MAQFLLTVLCLVVSNLAPGVIAQLSGKVGPTTSAESKRATVCNVLQYGGVASKTSDIGPAIQSAFAACKNGGTGQSDLVLRSLGGKPRKVTHRCLPTYIVTTVYVPPGQYGMSTWVSLSGGQNWAFQLDGIIYRTG